MLNEFSTDLLSSGFCRHRRAILKADLSNARDEVISMQSLDELRDTQ